MAIFVYAQTATGKTSVSKKYKNVIDMESSIFKYLNNDFEDEKTKGLDNRKLNPNWPNNYFNALEKVKDDYDYVLISDDICQQYLWEKGYEYWQVFPSIELKDEYLKRCKERGNNDVFISHYNREWESWINWGKQDSKASKKIELKSGEYLENVLPGLIEKE